MAKKNNKINNLPEMLTIQQTSDLLNVHPNTLRNWDNQGVLKAIRYGKRRDRRYRKKDVQKVLTDKNNHV